MTIQDQIENTVERARALWGIATVAGGIWVLVAFPLWALFPYVLFSVLTYFGAILTAGLYLTFTLPSAQVIAEAQAHGLKELASRLGEEISDEEHSELLARAGVVEAEIIGHSEPFGQYLDNPMYDWVDLKMGDEVQRFHYLKIADKDVQGHVVIPSEPGFAHFFGIIYQVQPD